MIPVSSHMSNILFLASWDVIIGMNIDDQGLATSATEGIAPLVTIEQMFGIDTMKIVSPLVVRLIMNS